MRLPVPTAPLLLEEEIAELLLAGRRVDVSLCGGRGLGKTTALAHLAATFADDVRLRLVDGVLAGAPDAELVTVRARRSCGPGEGLRFDLLPWTDDEVLEYLLAMHLDRVGAASASNTRCAPTTTSRRACAPAPPIAACGAHFEDVDLRSTGLGGANCRGAWFVGCNLAGTTLPGFAAPTARFTGSDLTGGRWRGANLAGASFQRAGLAEVDWEGADLRDSDLRRASFHLGNARSGLVDSAIASEGSRTGFYTDESLEVGFQPPEDVRKANLRECDLRGARIDCTDFYLVDVRGARLDAGQRDWLRRCRAILDPE